MNRKQPAQLARSAYEEAVADLDDLGRHLVLIIENTLQNAGIYVHVVRHRVKKFESATQKLASTFYRFAQFRDLHDLLGVRVITYFPDQVNEVASCITKTVLSIDADRSIDKRALHDFDRFGYMSLHYVATLSNSYCSLPAYAKFQGIRFEVQIRSILQHAWAETEHDLGYKSQYGIPHDFRRRFSRLAGLLELADEEFQNIRNGLTEYRDRTQAVISQKVADGLSSTLKIDQITLGGFIQNNNLLRDISKRIASNLGKQVDPKTYPIIVGRQADYLNSIGINTLHDLEARLEASQTPIIELATVWLSGRAQYGRFRDKISVSLPIHYLGFIELLKLDEEEARRIFDIFAHESTDEFRDLKLLFERQQQDRNQGSR
ncbi:hypothetical protein AB0J35_44945 [Nonomuraea angiospora]|uniref:GTP pyrophosphokinase n=1 Tax=Nonomuraea angiospora TaxID=46172 RepID=UPI003435D160